MMGKERIEKRKEGKTEHRLNTWKHVEASFVCKIDGSVVLSALYENLPGVIRYMTRSRH